MTGLITWSIIIITDLILISLGLYSAYRVIEAYQNKRDLTKYQGYLVNAFLLILLPIIFTFGGLKFISSENPNKINIGIEIKDSRGVNNWASFSSEKITFNSDNKKEIELNIFNNYEEDYKFSIDISCHDNQNNCEDALKILTPEKKEITIEPKMTFKLPISLNIKDSPIIGKHTFNITIKDKTNATYDSIPLILSLD